MLNDIKSTTRGGTASGVACHEDGDPFEAGIGVNLAPAEFCAFNGRQQVASLGIEDENEFLPAICQHAVFSALQQADRLSAKTWKRAPALQFETGDPGVVFIGLLATDLLSAGIKGPVYRHRLVLR